MPELPEVTQGFEANVTEFLAAMDAIIARAEEAAGVVGNLETDLLDLGASSNAAAVALGRASSSASDLERATVGAGAAADATAERVADLRNNLLGLAGADELVAGSMEDLTRIGEYLNATFGIILTQYGQVIARSGELFAMNRSLAESFGVVTEATATASISESELAAMNERLTASFGPLGVAIRMDAEMAQEAAKANLELAAAADVAAASNDKAAAAGTLAGTRWWTLGMTIGQALHWIVMGTLEIAATAVPALVAFGAAIVVMEPAFAFIHDQLVNLVTASGSLTAAIRNSASPLSSLAAGLGQVDKAATPDAFIILGSAISAVSSHMGAFSGLAVQAANVLADFANKVANELSGPLGQQLSGFFANALKYMIQWGQFLGNIGHTFVNVMSSMWGVGQLLLDVLNLISRALLVISSSPIGAFFIGLAAAMSALYRYSVLLVGIFNWLGGSALVGAIKWAVGYATALAGLAAEEGIVAAATLAMGDIMDAALGPVGIAIMAVTAALGVWYLASRRTSDATTNLIKSVESGPQTIMALSSGIDTLSGALVKAQAHLQTFNNIQQTTVHGGGLLGAAQLKTEADISALNAALTTQEGKLAHLAIGLAQVGNTTGLVGANMLALSIQTDLQDSKVQALNQAWDAYFSLLSGGMSSVAAFATSLQNIGQVAGTTANNLGTATGTMNLSTKQFADQLSLGAVKGAAAWTNFSQITQSTIPQMIDWFRTANTAGAISSQNFSKSVLDMIAPLMQFANNGGPAAKAILVGLAQAAGLGITSFPQLANAIKTNNASLANLNTQATNATVAMSQMNQVAKNLSNTLSVQEANAIANAALKASGFTTDVNNMLKAEQTHSTVGGLTWQQWAAKAAGAQQQVQADAAKSVSAIQKIQQAEDALHNKTITINVITAFTSTGFQSAYYQGAGTQGKVHPASGGYITGPGTGTSDSIPAMLSNGEYVIRAAAVEHYGRGLMDAMNSKRLASGGSAAGSGGTSAMALHGALGHGGTTHVNQTLMTTVKLRDQVLGTAIRRNSLIYDRRNSGNNLALRYR